LLTFFNYFTHTPYFQQACFQSSIGIDVEKMVLKLDNWLNTPMYLPPLEEQDTIAALLNSSASVIDVLHRLSLALTARKDAVLEEVLRDIVSGSQYGSTTLGAVTSIVTERATEADQSFCVDLENIVADEGRLVQLGESPAPSGNRVVFREGDVLYGKLRPYLRKYWLANRAGSCSGEIWVLRSNRADLAPSLLFYIVQSTAFERATKVVSGSKMPRADWRLVSQLPIVLPEPRRQEEVAGYLAACDSEIDLVRRRLELQRELHGQLVVELTSGGRRHRRYARG
jgi:type I restriction enzyme, S subunit